MCAVGFSRARVAGHAQPRPSPMSCWGLRAQALPEARPCAADSHLSSVSCMTPPLTRDSNQSRSTLLKAGYPEIVPPPDYPYTLLKLGAVGGLFFLAALRRCFSFAPGGPLHSYSFLLAFLLSVFNHFPTDAHYTRSGHLYFRGPPT